MKKKDNTDKKHLHKIGSWYRKACTWICHTFNSKILYPKNTYITVEELLFMMSSPNQEDRPLLIDARKQSEFEESHIEGAINIHSVENLIKLNNLPRDKVIICYCAVGLRSGYIAKKIHRTLGFKAVYTLKGAFYRWANLGLPMVNEKGERVYKVLPHQILARTLLKPEIISNEE